MSATAQSVPVASAGAKAKQASGWDHLKHLLPYVVRYKGMSLLGLLSLTLMGIVGALPQLIIGSIMDCLKGSPQALATLSGPSRTLLQPLFSFYAPMSRHALGIYCLLLVGVMLVKGFLSFWSRWILIGISREIEYDIRNDLLSRLLRLEPEFYVRNRTGDLMSRATNDLNSVRMVLGPGIMYSATTLATMVLAIFFMAKLSPSLTLWVLIPLPFVVVAVRYFGQVIHRLSERIQAALGVLSTRAQENLTGIRVIRAYVQEKSEVEAFDAANRDYVNENIKLISSWSLFFPALSAMVGVTAVILLEAGGVQVIHGRLSIGTLSAFYAFLIQLTFPMIAMGWVTNIFQRGAASMGRLQYILTAEPNICDENSPVPHSELPETQPRSALSRKPLASPLPQTHAGNGQPSIHGEIEFRHLTFAYPTTSPGSGSGPVLHDINLHIPAGSSLAIVGPTGSGKSTLAALIARLWEAPEGTLLVDGRSIREYPLATLRKAIGYVPQDTFLFSETLRENIAFGVADATEERVLEASEIASISGEIQSFPQRFETMVGERGVTLSGGQKQRTSLARAILRQPKILILDDALSSVDTDTEERILRRLRELMKERTTVLIAHRVSTVKGADQIIVMREGRVIERGTHDELLALDGYYADLYRKQFLEEELRGSRMSDFREEEKLGKVYDAQLTRRLLKYMRPYKGWVWLAVSMSLGVLGTELAGPYLFGLGIDRYIVPGFSHAIPARTASTGLLWVVLIFTVSLLASFGLQYAQVRIMQWIGQETMYDLRKEIFERLQQLPMTFFDRSPVGRLVTRATTDVDALNDLFASGVVAMLNDFVMLFGLAGLLFYLHKSLALAALSPLPLMVLLTYFFRNFVRDANRRIRTAIARINAFLQEHISGMAIVQLFNREPRSREQFAELNRVHMEAYKAAIDAFSFFYPAVEFLSMGGIALLYWFGGLRVIGGTVQIGVLFAFMIYAQRFFRPIQDLSEKFNILQTAMAASERIFRLLDEPLTIVSASSPRSVSAARGEIEFRNVWFAYHGGATPKDADWVLRDVSFRVEHGQTLAIVGHTGAGKTTIIQLLLRFYDIQRGEILLDGIDIREMALEDLRHLFGIVLQDPFLFTGTLESNVKLATPAITRSMTERALREVGLGPFLESLPRGVETPVTERGSTLSVGQRQLVSFARALAHNPKFLILDEATSSVDTKTELMIREALDRLITGRTAVIIAHRLSTIQHADRILVFHKGRLREQGSHQELLAVRGIYYKLYQLQYKEQELVLPITGAAPAGFSQSLPGND